MSNWDNRRCGTYTWYHEIGTGRTTFKTVSACKRAQLMFHRNIYVYSKL